MVQQVAKEQSYIDKNIPLATVTTHDTAPQYIHVLIFIHHKVLTTVTD